MAELSISRAWDESKERIAADGRLFTVVAAALVALPALVMGVVNPAAAGQDPTIVTGLIMIAASLVAIIGQLAIIRLAIAPGVSVGEAIGHGARRMPIYFLAGILILLGLILLSLPFVGALVAAGVPLENRAVPTSGLGAGVILLYFVLVCFVAVRLLMTSPVASEERVGPIGIIRRSWQLTSGHWWRLFGFLLLFLIGVLIIVAAVGWAFGFVAVVLLGPVEPMSASALVIGLVEAVVNAAVTVLLAVMLARIYVQLSGHAPAEASVPKSGT